MKLMSVSALGAGMAVIAAQAQAAVCVAVPDSSSNQDVLVGLLILGLIAVFASSGTFGGASKTKARKSDSAKGKVIQKF